MGAIFAAAWRVVLLRTRADWLILAAAASIVLLATTLLAAGPIYAQAVATAGLHRTLRDAPITESNVQIRARVRPSEFRAFDDAVARAADATFGSTGGPLVRSGRSDSFQLPEQPGDEVRNLTLFAFYEDLPAHATLVEGSWPEPGGAPVRVAISDSAAAQLGWSLGQRVELASRREGSFVQRIEITGIYHVTDPADPVWFDEPLDVAGVEEGESFTTYGPLVVDAADFFGVVTDISSDVIWRFYPIFENLAVSEVGGFRGALLGLEARAAREAGAENRFRVDTELDEMLRRAERSLLVTRTGVMILTIQLAMLAGYALVLTAGLLVEQRRVETALLRSRGASSEQVGAMALMEGLVLAVPAAILGPLLAAASLRLLNALGPLRAIDLRIDPRVTSGAWLLAALAAAACVLALTTPAWRSAQAFVEARGSRGRQSGRGIAQRAGLDLALLLVAALGYWQLRRYGAPITESVQGRLGLDPFLVAAPALGLLAGAVVALRAIPWLARVVERITTARPGLVPSLGAWQVARRPARYTRAALLLMLALAIGLFAVAYTRTWNDSQRDQADFQVGADLRVRPDIRVGSAIPPLNLASAYEQVEGVEVAMPVSRDTLSVSRVAGTGRLLSLDATRAEDVVHFRPDLAAEPFGTLLPPLAEARPELGALALPGEPARLALEVAVDATPVEDGVPASERLQPAINLVVQDGRGLLYRLPAGRFTAGSEPERQQLEVTLTHDLGNGAVATPNWPLRLVAVEMRLLVPIAHAQFGTFRLTSIQVSDAASGDGWTPVDLTAAGSDWTTTVSEVGGLFNAPIVNDPEVGQDELAYTFFSGAVGGDVLVPSTWSLRPRQPSADDFVIATLVSRGFLDATQTAVGDELQIDIAGSRRASIVTGVVEAFPTESEDGASVVVVDDPTLAAVLYLDAGRVVAPDEWWLAIDDGRAAGIVSALEREPYASPGVLDRFARADTLRTDPVALGVIGALSLGFVAAALFASVGFVVSAAVSARERLTEFALLRALGLSPRQLSGWLSLENGMLVLVSLVGGTLLGLLVSWLVLPFVTLTQEAREVVPGIIVTIPWAQVIALEAVTLGALAIVVGLLAVLLRRLGLGSVLRLGEE